MNYRKHFTDFITFPFTITCCYMYSVQDVLNTLGVVVSLSTHVQHPSNLSGFLDSFSTEEVIIPQVTAPNTPTLFFHTQPGCSFPHTFPLQFILLTIFCCHYSVNKKRIDIGRVCCLESRLTLATPENRCHTPEFVRCENDPALQEQRGEHPEQETQAQRGEEAFKVDMFQPGI